MTDEELASICELMSRRDRISLLSLEEREEVRMALADTVPALVAEIRRLHGHQNEPWRDGECCTCRYDPQSNKQTKICELHAGLAQLLVDTEKDRDSLKAWQANAAQDLIAKASSATKCAIEKMEIEKELQAKAAALNACERERDALRNTCAAMQKARDSAERERDVTNLALETMRAERDEAADALRRKAEHKADTGSH